MHQYDKLVTFFSARPKPTFTDCPTSYGHGRVNGSYVLLNSRYVRCICGIEESSDYTPGDIFLSVTGKWEILLISLEIASRLL